MQDRTAAVLRTVELSILQAACLFNRVITVKYLLHMRLSGLDLNLVDRKVDRALFYVPK